MDKQKKEKIAVAIALVLIALVAIITIIRSTEKKKPAEQNTASNQTTQKNDFKNISAKDLQQSISQRKHLAIIDVRSSESYAIEHILDSISLPSDQSLPFPVIEKEKQIIIVGEGAQDQIAEAAYRSFADKGYTEVSILTGGFAAWKASGNQTVTYGDATSITDQVKVSYISTDDLKKTLDAKNQFILDVRDKNAFTEGHLKNAVNVPFDELEERRREISSTKKVIVCGQNETQEFQAAVKIYDMKLVSPFVLKGSVEKWKQQGFELVK